MLKSYSFSIPDQEKSAYAAARLEDVDASYKDLSQVCGRIKDKKTNWAEEFLAKAATGEIPVLFKSFNKKLGHRSQLLGSKGRFPKKAAGIVLRVLKSAVANARVKNLTEDLVIVHVSANKKNSYPRMASKGRRSRSFLETARIEIILKGKPSVESKVEVKKPEKPVEASRREEVTQALEEKAEKKLEQEIKKEIIQTEEKKKEAKDEKKTEIKERKQPVDRKVMRPRQVKG